MSKVEWDDNYFPELAVKLDNNLGNAAKYFANQLASQVPVDSGKLRSSIKVSKRQDGYKVGMEFYGFFYEYGTKRQEAKPFVRPTLKREEEAIMRKMGENI